ncbi:hypothetical protein ACFE04_010273 [Oxalis oulophora]
MATKDEIIEPSLKKSKLAEAKSSVTLSTAKSHVSVEPTSSPVVKVFNNIIQIPSSSNSQENMEKSIALFFFENKLDFSVARSSSYQQMIDAIAKCGPGFTGPSAEVLKTTWLSRVKSENYGNIFVSPCASQCVNQILEEFLKVDWVSRCIIQAQTISKFIYNNSSILDIMKKYIGGQDLIRTGITKSVSNFLSLQSMLKQRSRLKHMFNSPEYSTNCSYANKSQSMSCISIIEDNDFWQSVEECVAISEPFLKVLREINIFTRTHGMFKCNLAVEARNTIAPEVDPIQFDDIDMTSEWVEESENPSSMQWLDRFGSALDGNDLNTRQFSSSIFATNDNLFGL